LTQGRGFDGLSPNGGGETKPPFALSLSKGGGRIGVAFHCYILRCSDGSYYTGQTEDLDVRLAQHERGAFDDCYTYTRRPVALVWSQDFGTRYEALEAERRIKGWSRAKKQALIAGDWDGVFVLARNWQVGTGPSTGSGQALRQAQGERSEG